MVEQKKYIAGFWIDFPQIACKLDVQCLHDLNVIPITISKTIGLKS